MGTVTTLQQPSLPAESPLSKEQLSTARQLFGIPDIDGLSLPADPSPQDLADLWAALGERLANAGAIYALVIGDIAEMQRTAYAQIKRSIPEGAKMVPHESLNIELEQRYERERDVATLRAGLQGKVPTDELRKALFIKSVDVKGCADQGAIDALVATGAKPIWECDLRALDKMARDYGGEIADTIKDATKKVPLGEPQLRITPKAPALKVVS